jgi:hypothetical protein
MTKRSPMTRKRITVIGVALVLAIAFPVSWWTFREKTAEAQNPMGDGATAAAAEAETAGTRDARVPRRLAAAVLRIVAYYGHPNSTRMGVLGEYPKDEMLRRLRNQVAEWERADPATPVIPALHMVAVVAQGEPGTAGHYRTITADARVQEVYDWARK